MFTFPGIRTTLSAMTLAAATTLAPVAAAADDEDPGQARPGVVVPRGMPAAPAESLPVPTERTTLFFNPQDANGNTTVLFLTNTTRGSRTARITGFNATGGATLDTTITLPPLSVVRVAADAINTTAPSWANTVIVNFTDFTFYAQIVLQRGVIVEGYVAWNNGPTYDPNLQMPRMPLRFWSR